MKLFISLLVIVFAFFFLSCSDNPVEPKFSIVEEINNARPFRIIYINRENGNLTFDVNGQNNSFTNAYAENDYFIVISNSTKYYFSISLAKEIQIYSNTISFKY